MLDYNDYRDPEYHRERASDFGAYLLALGCIFGGAVLMALVAMMARCGEHPASSPGMEIRNG